jgi:hypothetical protein
MPKPYYSTVLRQSDDDVWLAIRDFGSYSWARVPGETRIEEGKRGDAVGGIRNFHRNDLFIRQKLLAHSDRDRSYTYGFCEPASLPLRDCVATIRVTPITDGNHAFVEWWATFDCMDNEIDRWNAHFMKSFHLWLEALRTHLTT